MRPGTFRIGPGEATGAVADLGVLVPLAASLILVNGLDPGPVLIWAGVLVLVAGLAFRVPFPVQPLKALTAVAVAERLSPEVIHAAGIEIGAFLLLLSIGAVADGLARLFTKPVVRALQLGVGVLLVVAAVRMVLDPPPVFRGTPPSPWPVVLAVGAFVGVAWTARRGRYATALILLGAGVAAAWLLARPPIHGPSFRLPDLALPPGTAFASAFLLLVVPQLPLTFGNAVVAVSDLAHDYFGRAARLVRPWSVCLSCGLGNVTAGLLGGMPMCHGAGGLTAHVRLGARTAGMNLLLGAAFLALGLFFAPQVPVLLGLLPVWALAAFLAYAGLRHALLVADLRGVPLGLALAAGALGAALGNLAVTAGAALVVDHARRWWLRRSRGRRQEEAAGTGPEAPASYSTSSNSPS
jgi:sulfate permease, SulP family